MIFDKEIYNVEQIHIKNQPEIKTSSVCWAFSYNLVHIAVTNIFQKKSIIYVALNLVEFEPNRL